MKNKYKNYLVLIIIYLAITGLGYFITSYFSFNITFSEWALLNNIGLVIAFLSSVVFFIGFRKNDKGGILHTFSAVGLKFLLFLATLGVFAYLKKDLSVHFLLAFFITYLSYTLYLLITFVIVLKKRNKEKPDGKEK